MYISLVTHAKNESYYLCSTLATPLSRGGVQVDRVPRPQASLGTGGIVAQLLSDCYSAVHGGSCILVICRWF